MIKDNTKIIKKYLAYLYDIFKNRKTIYKNSYGLSRKISNNEYYFICDVLLLKMGRLMENSKALQKYNDNIAVTKELEASRKDTLVDMAVYCLLELAEMELKGEENGNK